MPCMQLGAMGVLVPTSPIMRCFRTLHARGACRPVVNQYAGGLVRV